MSIILIAFPPICCRVIAQGIRTRDDGEEFTAVCLPILNDRDHGAMLAQGDGASVEQNGKRDHER